MMDRPNRIAKRRLVLLGLGHTNAHILRMWKMFAYHDTELVCLSNFGVATYSGMLPAVLAGQIPPEQMQIDLVRLCASANARLITAPVTGLDPESKLVHFDDRPSLAFDALSIGIGSQPTGLHAVTSADHTVVGESVLAIKPMQTFLQRLESALGSASRERPLRVAIVGGGVAGLEIAFCLPNYIREQGQLECEVSVVTRGETLVSDMANGTRRRLRHELSLRNVSVRENSEVVDIRALGSDSPASAVQLTFADGESTGADLVIWATGAAPPPLLGQLGLPLAQDGFLQVNECLQTTAPGNLPIFAVGDTATIQGERLPKSGVYAVRQGPVLWDNLRRSLYTQPLRPFEPQRTFMRLINLGDGRAVGQWRGWSFSGQWAMRWKEWIDQRFMDMFEPEPMPEGDEPMQCRGCGCKFDGAALEQSLALSSANVIRDDAARVGAVDDPGARPLYASTDFFTLPFQDPYLSGRVAALHAASDLTAMGAQAHQALANVVLPEGAETGQQHFLSEFLEGARRELTSIGAELVGGHTTVGPRAEAGFTVIGSALGQPLQKQGMQPGDQLILTKPLGIGALLAAHFRARCRADHYQGLVEAMLAPQHPWAAIATELDLKSATDVTGFGLAGHLLEMLDASDVGATLRLDDIPALPGALTMIEEGIESSLAPSNHRWMSRAAIPDNANSGRLSLLSDPQTCGGLLLAAPAQQVDALFAAAAANELMEPVIIGETTPRDGKPLRIC